MFRTIFTALRALLKSGLCATQLCIRSDTASYIHILWKVIAKNVSCLKYWVHFFKGDSHPNSDLARKFLRPGIVSKAFSMMCHSIWQQQRFLSKKRIPPQNHFRILVTPISGFWFVTDANLYLVFPDVFVLVCISLLCVTKAFSVICHSHRQLLIHRWCTIWSLVHPLQCAWICTASFLWPDTKGNLSRLTR